MSRASNSSLVAAVIVAPGEPDREVSSAPLRRGRSLVDHFTLDQLQEWVGGFVEVGAGGRWVANEDGTALGMVRNISASSRAGIGLVGPVVFFVCRGT